MQLGKYPLREMSSRGNVQSEKCPVGEIAARGNVNSGKCRSGKCPIGEVSGSCLFHGVGNGILKSFCKDSNHCMYMTQLKNNLASWLILTDNKIPITVKILVYFLSLSRIAFKTYEIQYRSKYSVRFTQLCVEGKDFEFSALLNSFAGTAGVWVSRCLR